MGKRQSSIMGLDALYPLLSIHAWEIFRQSYDPHWELIGPDHSRCEWIYYEHHSTWIDRYSIWKFECEALCKHAHCWRRRWYICSSVGAHACESQRRQTRGRHDRIAAPTGTSRWLERLAADRNCHLARVFKYPRESRGWEIPQRNSDLTEALSIYIRRHGKYHFFIYQLLFCRISDKIKGGQGDVSILWPRTFSQNIKLSREFECLQYHTIMYLDMLELERREFAFEIEGNGGIFTV